MHIDYFKTIFWILFDLIEKFNKSKDLDQTTSLIADTIRELKEKNILKDEDEWNNGGRKMTYKCLSCGHIFEEGEQRENRECIGEYWGRPVYETTSVCPHCGGAYEKTVACELCGSDHLNEELCGGVCEECFDEHQNAFELCKKFADDECDTEFIEINAFLASVFDVADIEQILMDFLRNNMPDVDCRNFINNDKSWFGEKLVKEVSKNENKKG